MSRLIGFFSAFLLLIGLAIPAQAAVTVTFWSHEFGNSFPHAFVSVRGVPDAGGPAVDTTYGFTARTISPAILFGAVPGRVEPLKPSYIASSDAQFSMVLTDAQYNQLLALVSGWSEKTGDATYRLNGRNCVHFVKEAARAVGLSRLDYPKLMKKPRSYLLAVQAANAARVTKINQNGKAYLATLPPLASPALMPAPARGLAPAP
ncbi:MAG: hypothetical protein JWN21_2507 [Sphingomonas bacterium]|uniref:hypothetical protein n=1 Tax=Sphingomonas bacterium TaxID=1895847 RepID=UPI002633B7C3|nr:hypothetical protein [Sphingomonas bacterium]MDB5696964.1 hypothetical protein [Sphingomonas bacterium]